MPAPDGPPHDLPRLIKMLDHHQVEYLIVGGAAAYAYGAERPTDDADCVVSRERANLDRLASALRELHARLRVGGMTDAEARTLPVQVDAMALDLQALSGDRRGRSFDAYRTFAASVRRWRRSSITERLGYARTSGARVTDVAVAGAMRSSTPTGSPVVSRSTVKESPNCSVVATVASDSFT